MLRLVATVKRLNQLGTSLASEYSLTSAFPEAVLPYDHAAPSEVDRRSALKCPSDELLIAEICRGDRDALAKLFERYARVTRRIAVRILQNSTEADDLVQDLFVFLQRKCGIFDSSRSTARSWIVQMAYHRSLDRRRYLKAREFYAAPVSETNGAEAVGNPTTESDYSAEVVFGRNGLEKIVDSLSNDQRETLRLHFFEGYTLAEVSQQLGQPLGNVRHHYYRALDRLRKHMQANDPLLAERCGRR